MWAFKWYQNRRPWMTLNGVMAIILHYFTEFGSFLRQLCKSGWLAINRFSHEKCHKVHQLSTTDALCSSQWWSFLFVDAKVQSEEQLYTQSVAKSLAVLNPGSHQNRWTNNKVEPFFVIMYKRIKRISCMSM